MTDETKLYLEAVIERLRRIQPKFEEYTFTNFKQVTDLAHNSLEDLDTYIGELEYMIEEDL